MPRLIFPQGKQSEFLRKVREMSWRSSNQLGPNCNVSGRTFRDWMRSKYSISEKAAKLLSEKFSVPIPSSVKVENDYWYAIKGARKGALRRIELYGRSFGTPEGRKKGGLNSIKSHKLLATGFYTRKVIFTPRRTTCLAELVGAAMGDGGINPYHLKIYLNIKTDKQYSLYLKKLIETLFKINVSIKENPKESVIVLTGNGVKLVKILHRLGLPIGDKLKQSLDIPSWIYKKRSWQVACLRGLLDTDGCTYIDHHSYKDRRYGHLGIAFTSYSPKLLTSIYGTLSRLGYTPTRTTKHRVLLRRESEILKFFKEFKPSNKRHYAILSRFLEEYRSGYNGTASKAVVVAR